MEVNKVEFQEYVKVPSFFKVEKVESPIVLEFLSSYPSINQKIDLTHLKNILNKNIIQGLELVAELRFRGFMFHTSLKSKLFYNNIFEYNAESKIIYTNNNNGKYKSLDINKFYDEKLDSTPTSDFYYNLIPLSVFKDKALMAEKEFLKAGFEIVTVEVLSGGQADLALQSNKLQDPIKDDEVTVNDYLIKNFSNRKFDSNQLEILISIFTNVTIEEFINFKNEKEIGLLTFLSKHHILTLYEALIFDFSKLTNEKKSTINGIHKLIFNMTNNIITNYLLIQNYDFKLLNDYRIIEFLSTKALNGGESLQSTIKRMLPSIEYTDKDLEKFKLQLEISSVAALFDIPGKRFNDTKEFFLLNKINNLRKLINFDFNILTVIKGVGIAHVEEVKDIFDKAIAQKFSEIIDLDTYIIPEKYLDLRVSDIIDSKNIGLTIREFLNNYNEHNHPNYNNDLYKIKLFAYGKSEKSSSNSNLKNVLKKAPDIDLEKFKIFLESCSLDTFLYNSGKRYRNTQQYFEKNAMSNMAHLINFDFSTLKKIKGLGVNHIEEIKSTYTEALDSKVLEYLELESYTIAKEYLNYKVFEIIDIDDKEMSIKGFLENYNKQNYPTYDFDLFRIKIYVYNFLDLSVFLSRFKLTRHSERNLNILKRRLYTNETLQEIGDIYGVTRERVRQVSTKLLTELTKSLEENDLISILKRAFNNRDYIHISEINSLLDEENIYFIGLLKENHINGLFYLDSIGRVYLNGFDEKKYLAEVNEFITDLPSLGVIEDLTGGLKTIFVKYCGLLSEVDFESVLASFDISISQDYYKVKNPTILDLLNFIFKHKIIAPFRIEEESIYILQKYSKQIMGDAMEDRIVRNWEAPLQRSEEVYLVGPRTYLHKTHQQIDLNTRQVLDFIVKNELSKNKRIPIKTIMSKLDKSLDTNPFISNHHLYSFVKDVYEENIDYAGGNLLEIYPSGIQHKSRVDLILEECEKNNGFISIAKVKEKFGFSTVSIENTVINSPFLEKLGIDNIMIVDQIITPEIKEKFNVILNDVMSKGFCSAKDIYHEATFDMTLNQFFNKHNLTRPLDIINLIKTVNPNIAGHTVFLYYKDQDIQSIEDYIMSQFDEYIYREEITKILDEYGFALNTQINLSTQRLINESKLIKVSANKYQRYECFDLDKSIQKEIADIIINETKDKDYIVLKKHLDKISKKVKSDIFINQHILYYILSKYGYKKLKRFNESYNKEIIVMVKDGIAYDSIDYLVKSLIVDKYKGSMTESAVFDYLASLGIYKPVSEPSGKTLKQDIFEHDLITVDLLKNVRIKEI